VIKVVSWTRAEWKKNLFRKLQAAKKARNGVERVWRENEKIIFTDVGQYPDQIVVTEENLLRFDTGETEVGQDVIGMNYAWKFLRFVHSQMSANPPSVLIRPASTDQDDHRRADAADRVARHLMRQEKIQEIMDQATLKALCYGIGYIATKWDAHKGDASSFNPATQMITMTGGLSVYAPSVWRVWLDPDATTPLEVRHHFEQFEIPKEEAISMCPGYC